MSTRARSASFACVAVLCLAALVGCAPEPSASTPTGSVTSGTLEAEATPTPSVSPTPNPTPVAMPTDCRAMLSDAVLSQLDPTPLNDAANGIPTGVQPDGTLVCLWRDPGADTTFLETTVSRLSRGPALDLLNRLADEQGFTCYTPAGGTRCEKRWINEQYPVEDGRTLFWRDDVLVDTSYSNLAPSGYTDSIVQHLFG